MTGKFYGIGVGPGDPELLTLKARRVLQEVDVLFIPRSSRENDSVAWSIVEPHYGRNKEMYELLLPMSRDQQVLEEHWLEGAEKILTHLRQGKNVAFVTIGDALLFSTYPYLLRKIRAMEPTVTVETVPGITSFASVAARVNLALTEAGEGLAVFPALENPEQLSEILEHFPNVVLMKVAPQFDGLVEVLEQEGLINNALMATRCGLEGEQLVTDLRSVAGKPDYLSLIIVKKGGLV